MILFLVACRNTKPLSSIDRCTIRNIRGNFIFEDFNSMYGDDTVLRDRLLLKYDGKIKYDTVYLVKPIMAPIYKYLSCEKVFVDKINNALDQDSMRDKINNLHTDKIRIKGKSYKYFYTESKVFFVGTIGYSFEKNDKIKFKKIPTYLVVNIQKIKAPVLTK